MLCLEFSDYEEEIRNHLDGMLNGKLFDFDRDIVSIAVNYWVHGYATGDPGKSTRIGRQPFVRIAIANADFATETGAKAAILIVHRAVKELG